MNRKLCAIAMLMGFGLADLGLTGPAAAAPPPDNKLLAGFVTRKIVLAPGATWCGIDRNDTTFIKRPGTQEAEISFAGINYTRSGSLGGDGSLAYFLNGQARLLFSNSTSGRIYFDAHSNYPTAVYRPLFDSYSASYNTSAGKLTLRMNILLPGCTLPVEAIYRN